MPTILACQAEPTDAAKLLQPDLLIHIGEQMAELEFFTRCVDGLTISAPRDSYKILRAETEKIYRMIPELPFLKHLDRAPLARKFGRAFWHQQHNALMDFL